MQEKSTTRRPKLWSQSSPDIKDMFPVACRRLPPCVKDCSRPYVRTLLCVFGYIRVSSDYISHDDGHMCVCVRTASRETLRSHECSRVHVSTDSAKSTQTHAFLAQDGKEPAHRLRYAKATEASAPQRAVQLQLLKHIDDCRAEEQLHSLDDQCPETRRTLHQRRSIKILAGGTLNLVPKRTI